MKLRALQRVGWALAGAALCAGLAPADFHLGTRVVAVGGAWLLLHTLFTLRYAHVCFSEAPTASPPDKLGGLQFPGDPPTRYWDYTASR